MNNDEINNGTDDLFRKGLRNLSEEQPSEQEWLKLKSRLTKEGLLAPKIKGWYYIPLSMLFIGAVVSSIYFFNKNGSGETKVPVIKREKLSETPTAAPAGTAALQDTNTNKEKERRTYAKVENKPKGESAIMESSMTKHKGISTPGSNSDRTAAGVFKKASTGAAGKRTQPARMDVASAANEKNTPETESKSAESKDEVTPGSRSNTNGISNEDTATAKSKADPAEMSGNKNSPGMSANAKNTVDTIGSDTVNANMKNRLAHTDSSKTVADATPVIVKNRKAERSRIHIGGLFSIDFNHYLVEKNAAVPLNDVNYVYASDSINGNSATQFTAGLTVAYRINDRVEVELGASYSKKKVVKTDLATPAYSIDSTQQAHSDYIYDYDASYLELSAKIKYYYSLGGGKWLYAGGGGIASFNFPENKSNLGYYRHISYIDTTWVSNDKVTLQPSSATLSAVLVAGFEAALSNRWSVFVEPEYKYAFNPVIKHPAFDYIPVNHYWRTFSIGFGLKYSLE